MSAADNQTRMRKRNTELGRMLHDARVSLDVTISECAALIGTGRPRYRAIENGEASVSAAELEILMERLQIPLEAARPSTGGSERKIVRLPITVSPDEVIYLVVDVGQRVG